MICALYDLKSEYRDKKKYIWNINRDSIELFGMLALRRIDIQGFITLQKEFEDEIYMNRPVYSLETVEWDEQSIIIVPDEVLEDSISILPPNWVYWSEAIGLNVELNNKRIIVYGAGYGAGRLCKLWEKENIDVELYCVTKRDTDKEEYRGRKIIEATELKNYEDCAVIISVITPQYRREILETLADFQGQIYLEHIIVGEHGEPNLRNINLIQIIDLAIRRKGRIYLYSERNQLSELIENVLSIYGIEIGGYVYDVENEEQGIRSIYELYGEGQETDNLIIINEESPERLIKARENVEYAGFSLEKETYTGIQWYTRANDKLLLNMRYSVDSLVGDSIIYDNDEREAGWKIYGEEAENRIHILVLGGSTSAEVWHPENWVSKLYYKLKQDNIKATIYNGAHEGNGIIEELLRLLRDGWVLKPQIVISLSGVNNLYRKKAANQFNGETLIRWAKYFARGNVWCSGLYSDESCYSFWSRNVKILKMVAESYGAKFFGFLQPINLTMDFMTLREKTIFEMESKIEATREFAQFVCDDEAYINLMGLFDHQDGMYFDMCHYTDKANAIIADKIYNVIMPTIQNLK